MRRGPHAGPALTAEPDRRDDVPDRPPGTEVPGEGKVAAPGSSEERDPAVPSPDLGDLDRVVEGDDEGHNQRATGDRS